MSSKQAHEFNLDAAQRELDSRNAQGEDVSELFVNPRTAAIERKADAVAKAAGKALEELYPFGYWSSESAP